MSRSIRRVLFGFASVALGAALPSLSFAQSGAGASTGGASTGASETARGAVVTPTLQLYPGPVAPTPDSKVLGGGNVSSSSSRPKLGNEQDTFDLGASHKGASSVRGAANGPVFIDTGNPSEPEASASVHVVEKGDTLWDISQRYFENAYEWPRVWSYNPQIQNPHWIEVGDNIRLRPGIGVAAGESVSPLGARGGGPSGRGGAASTMRDWRKKTAPNTIFLRDEGFLSKDSVEAWGEVTGAPEDKMFLMDTDEVYLLIAPGKKVSLGQDLTVYRAIRSVGDSNLVQIQGTVRVNSYDSRTRIARASVIETLDTMERGARVAVMDRQFEVVPPVRNEKDSVARVVASVTAHAFYGDQQVVYVDKGSNQGLVAGNRLLILHRGDTWRQSLAAPGAAKRIAMESSSPAAVDPLPTPRNDAEFPEEVIGEIRVLRVEKNSAMCLVVRANREIETNEVAYLRRGY